MPTLYDNTDSGNAYKVRLLLHKLGLPAERVELDTYAGETRTEAFLAKNPNGKIPALELDDGAVLPESNAILWYLAEETPYLPADRLGRARVLQWMFFEQYSHEPAVAVARSIRTRYPAGHPRQAEVPSLLEKGAAALRVMDGHLTEQRFFAGDALTIADIALYAYTHVAGDGGFDLSPYAGIAAWLDRVADDAPHIPMIEDRLGERQE